MLYSTEYRPEILKYFDDYFNYGGLHESNSLSSKRDYILSVYQKIYLGDIATRYIVENNFALKVIFKKNCRECETANVYHRFYLVGS